MPKLSRSWRAFGKVAALVLGFGLIVAAASCVATMGGGTPPELVEEVRDLDDVLYAVEVELAEVRAEVAALRVTVQEGRGTARSNSKRRPPMTRRSICPLFGI